MPADSAEKKHAARVVRRLKKDFPVAECALNFETPFQLLIATILSAQCTDERVNMVTAELFKIAPDAVSMAALTIKQLEKLIKSSGFFRNKAKNIRACCAALLEHYDGDVPQQLELLVELPGVGRKTANVVLGTAFDIPSGVVVDTHVGRLTRRLGMTTETDPVRVERVLMEQLPKREWIGFSHRLIYHGRQVCKARKPDCENCSMAKFCPRVGVEPAVGVETTD